MKPVKPTFANEMLYRRLDAMSMSVIDREFAKAQLRDTEIFIDGVFALVAAMRSAAAFVARQLRIALTASPQH
jgi:hypothetical protein